MDKIRTSKLLEFNSSTILGSGQVASGERDFIYVLNGDGL
jgi:hypothetical protein